MTSCAFRRQYYKLKYLYSNRNQWNIQIFKFFANRFNLLSNGFANIDASHTGLCFETCTEFKDIFGTKNCTAHT